MATIHVQGRCPSCLQETLTLDGDRIACPNGHVHGERVFDDGQVQLWHGRLEDVLPQLDLCADSCVTDPPYVETSAAWDVWPVGWPTHVAMALPPASSLWCFGSMRMFLEHSAEFTGSGWRHAQESLWAKPNGSGPARRDRLNRVHEWAVHWYRGRWSDLHHEWERVPAEDGDKGHVRRAAHGTGQRGTYTGVTVYDDDGLRLPQSVRVMRATSVRGAGRHLTEKPLSTVMELVRECTPPGGTVLDPMAGSGTTGVAARMLGRRAVLIEADEDACAQALGRLEQNVLALEGL